MKIMLRSIFLMSLAVLLPFAFFTHPFEVPDENAHFASLHFLHNEGRMPTAGDKDNLSLEELKTEEIFGIVEGKNKYSFHPEFRVEQGIGKYGVYEELIRNFNTTYNRTTYSTHQSALYPPLYYQLALPIMQSVGKSDILTRLFVTRLTSVILTSLLVVVAYMIGLEIFRKQSWALTLSIMTLFYPMTTYIGSGFNSDNLHNLLFAIASLLALKLIYRGYSPRLSLFIGTVIGLDILTKPQAYILFPIFALAIIIRWRWSEWRTILLNSLYVLGMVLIIAGYTEISKLVGGSSYIPSVEVGGGLSSLKTFFSGYLHTHLSEMPVWYWGVFKWFGVVLPKPWWWVATRLIALSGLGIILSFYRDWSIHKLSPQSRFVLFSLGANAIYALALLWFDWQFYQRYGRSLGLQARYYMPLLITQMGIILYGLGELSKNNVIHEWIRRGAIIFFLGLQLTALYTQLSSYYDFTTFTTFIDQLSQYKPYFAKGNWWYLWFPLYFIGIIITTLSSLKKDKSKN